MDRRKKAEELAGLLAPARRVLILTHKNPDGDAIGSSLALAYCLLSMGKEVENVNVDAVPEALSWLEGADMVQAAPTPAFNADTLILLDCNDFARTGLDPAVASSIPQTLVVDHHPYADVEGPGRFIDPTAAASGVLVYELIRALGCEVTPSVALDLYIALHTDTGGFRFPNTDADTFRLAADLVEAGAMPSYAAVMLLEREDAARMKLLGLALGTLELAGGGRVAHCHVTLGMFAATGTRDEHTDGFVNYPRSVEGVEVALLFKEKAPMTWRVALRSRGLLDVSAIAHGFGGGGHRNASGATLNGTLPEVTERIVSLVVGGLDELGA